MEFGFNDPLRK